MSLIKSTLPAEENKIIINPEIPGAVSTFILTLNEILNNISRPSGELLILCIGSDRSTGDALGPLVGSMLQAYPINNAKIMGTLSEPVHALNFEQKLAFIGVNYFSPIILQLMPPWGKNKILVVLK